MISRIDSRHDSKRICNFAISDKCNDANYRAVPLDCQNCNIAFSRENRCNADTRNDRRDTWTVFSSKIDTWYDCDPIDKRNAVDSRRMQYSRWRNNFCPVDRVDLDSRDCREPALSDEPRNADYRNDSMNSKVPWNSRNLPVANDLLLGNCL